MLELFLRQPALFHERFELSNLVCVERATAAGASMPLGGNNLAVMKHSFTAALFALVALVALLLLLSRPGAFGNAHQVAIGPE